MHHHYRDIRDRIAELPKWWDENGVPRYSDFDPQEAANIYAPHAVLLLIECQGCGTEFKVCMTDSVFDRKKLPDLIEADEIHYGDPPNTGCCPAGPTMNSIPLRVLECWRRWNGRRMPELERAIACDWADNDTGDD